MIKVEIDEDNLMITIPRRSPRPSASGKTIVLGTTRGVKTGEAKYKGQPVCVVASAFIYPKQGNLHKFRLITAKDKGEQHRRNQVKTDVE